MIMEQKRVSYTVAKAIKEAGYPQYENELEGVPKVLYVPTYFDVWLWLWREKELTRMAIWDKIADIKGNYFDPEEAIIAAIDYLVDNNLIKRAKKIEFKNRLIPVERMELNDEVTPSWDQACGDYHFKPEAFNPEITTTHHGPRFEDIIWTGTPGYRPYANIEECFKEVQKHGGWIKLGVALPNRSLIIYVGDGYVCIKTEKEHQVSFYYLSGFVWADDGSPCGVKEE